MTMIALIDDNVPLGVDVASGFTAGRMVAWSYAGSKLEVRMSDFCECIPVYRSPVVDIEHTALASRLRARNFNPNEMRNCSKKSYSSNFVVAISVGFAESPCNNTALYEAIPLLRHSAGECV